MTMKHSRIIIVEFSKKTLCKDSLTYVLKSHF